MSPVLGKEFTIPDQLAVGQRLFIYTIEYFGRCSCKTKIEPSSQFLIKGSVQVILYHFFTKESATPLITQYIAKTRAVLYNFLSVIITGIGTRAKDTGDTLFFPA